MIRVKGIITIVCFLAISSTIFGQHPSLSLTPEGVKTIRTEMDKVPLFKTEYLKTKTEIDKAIEDGLDVPIPKDMAGGYTHETHKRNYKILQKAGNIYQISGEEKYAAFIKNVLFEYAEMYPKIGLHPSEKSYARGKIFWQCLNDANWLVFTSQAYDCIYNYLKKKERKHLEKNLFIPFANHLSIQNPKFFNRIHNHSTWANSAVGMMALAMENEELLEKALYGLKNDGIDPNEIDNDGGYIKKDGVRQAGFLAQLDYSFSPDGYFSEGPYYQRYAIFPFLVFSYALHNTRPELNILEYNNAILKKATNCLLQLTNPNGEFFPINDAQKGMTFTTYELVTAVDLMYFYDDSQTNLLNWAKAQNTITLDEAGFYTAKMLSKTAADAPNKKSIVLGDGPDGTEGGIAVLRAENTDLLFKYSAQGMGHGHFDRLGFALYNKGGEIVQDYGAVRWVNIEQKGGGRYLPENKTFGKQTIAHNTLVVDGQSHYGASVKKAEKHHPELIFADIENENLQVISAIENNAYKGVEMQRTLFLLKDDSFLNPLVIDLFNIKSSETHTYELPTWFVGHQMQNNFECEANDSGVLYPLGKENGYQHIWKEDLCFATENMAYFTWFSNEKIYTKYTSAQKKDGFIIGRAGANDPSYNLRPDGVLVQKKVNQKNANFVNIIEQHGTYNRNTEVPIQPYGTITNLTLDYEDDNYVSFQFETEKENWRILVAFAKKTATKKHSLTINEQVFTWSGNYEIIKSKK